jgi:hypothetical protein
MWKEEQKPIPPKKKKVLLSQYLCVQKPGGIRRQNIFNVHPRKRA